MTDVQLDYIRRYHDASWFPGMGGGGTPPPPDPHIDSLVPPTAVVGQPVTVLVNGTNFVAGSVVEADQAPLPTVFISATQLSVSGTPLVDGDVMITVRNPNEEESNSVLFTVTLVAADAAAAPAKNGNGKRKAVEPEAEPEVVEPEVEPEPEV